MIPTRVDLHHPHRHAIAASGRREADRDAGHRWLGESSGSAKSITDLAEQEGVTDAYVCRLILLICLTPDIVEAVLDGRQPKGLRLAEMLGNRPLARDEERRNLSR